MSDFFPGEPSANPYGLKVVNDHLIFNVAISDTLDAFYSINTNGDLEKLFEFAPIFGHGTGIGYVSTETNIFEKRLLFVLEDRNIPKQQLWITDGTKNGTFFLKDVSQFASFNISNLFLLNDEIYFLIDGEETALWKTNGTTAGTVRIKSLCNYNGVDPCYSQYNFDAHAMPNNKFIFFAGIPGEDVEPWITDGTTAGTNIFPIQPGILPFNRGMALQGGSVLNGKLIFGADIQNGIGFEPYSSDGTVAGTVLIKNINTTSGNNYHNKHGRPSEFYQYNSKVFFNANDGVKGDEIWVTDGTTAETKMLVETQPGKTERGDLKRYYPFNNTLLFQASSTPFDQVSKYNLFKTDGTPANTSKIMTFNSEWDCFVPKIEWNGSLIFAAKDWTNGSQLWKTDGSTGGTQRMLITNPVQFNEQTLLFSTFYPIQDKFYFVADNGNKVQLWKSNGNNTDTVSFDLLMPQPNFDYQIESCIKFRDKIYLKGAFDESGIELWEYAPETITHVDQNSYERIQIFPNPSTGNITVRKNNANTADIIVYDMLGNVAFVGKMDASIFHLQLNTGAYIIKVMTDNGDTQIDKLLILDHF
ncbi:MAG: T9SS type A sorting domain-containing protein [Chitinophagales bacterium]|nr:T9SS type A sorting domain-containing protein [Chitinophagales bacterium]